MGRTGGEPGENRGAQKNRGRTGGIWEENRGRTGGFLVFIYKEYRGEAGALGQEPGENRGREFSLNQRPKSEPENQRTGPPVKISRHTRGLEVVQMSSGEDPDTWKCFDLRVKGPGEMAYARLPPYNSRKGLSTRYPM